MFAQSSSSPDAVDDFNRIASSLSQKTSSEIKMTEERTKKVEMKSERSQESTFSSQIFHEGHNLFFQPQILIGSGMNASFFLSRVQNDTEYKTQIITNITDSKKDETFSDVLSDVLPEIPEAPTLSPLVMPDLPTPVVVQEHIVIKQQRLPVVVKEIIIEQDTVMMPELPAFIPLSPPRIPIEVILPKLPHIPTCLIEKHSYGFTVPCPPITVSSEIVGAQNIMVEKSMLEIKPLLNFRLPKIPLGIVINKPVKTSIPYPDGFISTTRFLPSVKVSTIPLQSFRHRNLLIPSRTSEVIVENIRGETVETGFSSFSAHCAHNIALERILPNIVIAK
ncbi:jg9492 [Pararge aegeria aegeria]|uniref:Jg9492 protein n=1 Tax=Pararge aegeria aegeria TaxID=348720 RepID=A0A8S4RK95_9NEOP|nr:jg9492 [Pararge aegeria aegeria]